MLDWIKKYDLFVLDLDNTLYDETLYLESAYSRIADWLHTEHSCDRHLVFHFLAENFRKNGRKHLFDQMESHFSIKPSCINTYLSILRTTALREKLPVLPPFGKLLPCLDNQKKHIAVLTNGNPQQQKNKVKHIDWPIPENRILFVYANELIPKPSGAGLEYIKSYFKAFEKGIFVGDSPIDEQAAFNAGMDYIDIKDPIFRQAGNDEFPC